MDADFQTLRVLIRVQRVLTVMLIPAGFGLYGEICADTWRTTTGMGLVVGVVLLLKLLLGIWARLCSKCPHCGKSFLSLWWNVGRHRLIMNRVPFVCAKCGEEVDPD